MNSTIIREQDVILNDADRSYSAFEAYVASKKTRQTPYPNGYRTLLNDVITQASDPSRSEYPPLEPSQIGAVTWTAAEKDRLFAAVASAGRDNVEAIARAVGSKSEHEVVGYLALFKSGVRELRGWAAKESGLLQDVEIPAAFEVSEQCDRALERAADAIAWSVERNDQAREQERHGEIWLLDGAVAAEVEDIIATAPPADTHESPNPVRAAELLHLENWLELTEILVRHDDEYAKTWAFHDDLYDRELAIYHTAFNDFHNLAVSLTRRLVQATIFQATSRLRALDVSARRRLDEVRHQDVYAAVQTLGLQSDWSQFWTGCARRNNLRVVTRAKQTLGEPHEQQGKSRPGAPRFLSYDEVETALKHKHDDLEDPQTAVQMAVSTAEPDPYLEFLADESDSDYWTIASESDGEHVERDLKAERAVNVDGEDSAPRLHSTPSSRSDESSDNDRGPGSDRQDIRARRRLYERREELIMEELDLQASKGEEVKLWKMLNRKSGSDVAPNDSKTAMGLTKDAAHSKSDRPVLKRWRSDPDELVDWRDRIRYVSDWEQRGSGSAIDDTSFAAVTVRGREGKRRRLEAIKMAEGRAQSDTTMGSIPADDDGPDTVMPDTRVVNSDGSDDESGFSSTESHNTSAGTRSARDVGDDAGTIQDLAGRAAQGSSDDGEDGDDDIASVG